MGKVKKEKISKNYNFLNLINIPYLKIQKLFERKKQIRLIKRKEKQEKERKRIKKQVSELLEEKEKYSRKYIYRKDDDKTIDSYLEKFVKEKEKPESALSLDPQVKNRRKEHGIDLK